MSDQFERSKSLQQDKINHMGRRSSEGHIRNRYSGSYQFEISKQLQQEKIDRMTTVTTAPTVHLDTSITNNDYEEQVPFVGGYYNPDLFQPQRGYYYDKSPTLDFSTLYPSNMPKDFDFKK
jgi:hypothetical protein